MKTANKVAFNTIIQYLKILITMGLALYSTRIVLNELGSADYGLFNLVAGVIAMLSFLNGAMTITTQRYLSFFLGAEQKEKLNSVFRTSITLHLIIGFTIVGLLEISGLFIFDGVLNIPLARIDDAKIIFQFMIITTFFTINAVPYDAAIVANEDLHFDSVVGIIESILKLGIAISLQFTSYNKLITYGLLLAALTILVRIAKSVWCINKYDECKNNFKQSFDKGLLKEMTSYASWNLFGALCYVGSSQGLAIILNIFFGTTINSAYAVANQINSQLKSFSVMMIRAVNPQIIKSEGSGNRERMIRLASQSSKFSVYLLLLFAMPMIIEMPFVLNIWLTKVPDYSVIFCILILINSIINQLSTGLKTAVQAVGEIKSYQSIVGSTILLVLPLSYIMLKWGLPAYSVLVASIFIEILALYFRILLVKKLFNMPPAEFMKDVVFKILMISVLIALPSYLPVIFLKEGFLRLLIVITISSISTFYFISVLGLTNSERQTFQSMFDKIIVKIRKRKSNSIA